jgi:glucose/mannose-6-phosphate isomerase
MENSINNFSKQFAFEPKIINAEKFNNTKKSFVLGGMGGSHLAGGIFKIINPEINLSIYRDYGLPKQDDIVQAETLYIASSHSGNTEEILDFADEAYSKGLDLIIITTGGKLLDFADENKIPAIILPNDGIQPRTALGYSLLALYKIILPEQVVDLQKLQYIIDPQKNIEQAKELAKNLHNKIPVIYTSAQNRAVAYNWKIKFNETGKIPAFYNSFPELNHNEMQGYDFISENFSLSEKIHFIFIHDSSDNERVEKRLKITEQLYQEKGLPVTSLFLEGDLKIEQIFNSLLLADWTALELAKKYGTEPEKVPLIEKFKTLL